MSSFTPNAPEIAPFGWYPDPAGTAMLRWWDGQAWTDRLEYPRPEVQVSIGEAPVSEWRQLAS